MPASKQRAERDGALSAARPRWPHLSALSARMRPRRARWAWIAALSAALLALYAVLGFVLAPRLVRAELTSFFRETYGRTLQLGAVRVNPFALSLELEALALADADGPPVFAVKRAFVDLEGAASLWRRAIVLRQVALEQPALRVLVRADGALNLADFAAREPSREPAAKREAPSLSIASVAIRGARVSFSDRSRAQPFERELEPASLELRDLHTRGDGGAFGFSAVTSDGAQLGVQGTLALAPAFASSGTFTLAAVPLPSLSEYLPDLLPFAIARGALEARGTYSVALDGELRAGLAISQAVVRELALRARGGGQAGLSVVSVAVAGGELLLHRRELDVAQVTLRGLKAPARLQPDGSLDLTRLFEPRAPQDDAPPAAPWSVHIRNIAVADSAVAFEDRRHDPPLTLTVAPIDIAVQNVSLDPTRSIPVNASLRLAPGGQIRVSGRVTPAPLAAELALSVSDAALSWAQPYLAQYADLTLREGRLGLGGQLALAPGGALSFHGDVRLDALRTVDNAARQPLFELAQLSLHQVHYQRAPDRLEIARVALHQPYARVVLGRDQTLNVASVFAARPPAQHPAASSGARATDATRDGKAQEAEAPLAVRVGAVEVDALRVNFSDYFTRPNFHAELEDLSGVLRGLSSDAKARAQLTLAGHIGGGAPVRVSGQLQPFAFDKYSDLRLHCENIALALFNPYSGRFAGYNIEKGELTTDVHYQLQSRKLAATHALRIDQLTWGEATESKEKAPLPVKLATALLRDRHGVIRLDLPIRGSLDEPAFRVGPLVWQVLKNIVVKAASAPFDLLGSLFRGAEQAKFVRFSPGSAELDGQAKAALAALAKALVERPQLRLDVPLGAAPELDRAALVEHKYQAQLTALLRSQRRSRRAAAPNFAALDMDKQIDLLTELYEQLTGDDPSLPPTPKPPRELSWKEARAKKKAFEVESLARAARAEIRVEPGELEALGRQRAEAIEAALRTAASGELAANRVLLSSEGKVRADGGKVRIELALQ